MWRLTTVRCRPRRPGDCGAVDGRPADAQYRPRRSADFAYVGVFSSGWFPNSIKEEQDTDVAQYRASGKPFRLFWGDARPVRHRAPE